MSDEQSNSAITPEWRRLSNLPNSSIRKLAVQEPAEAAQAIIALRAELDSLRRALWECFVLSGADTSGYDGPENWPGGTTLQQAAVRGVRELRADRDPWQP